MEATDILLFATIIVLFLQIRVNREQSKINDGIIKFMGEVNKELDDIQEKIG